MSERWECPRCHNGVTLRKPLPDHYQRPTCPCLNRRKPEVMVRVQNENGDE